MKKVKDMERECKHMKMDPNTQESGKTMNTIIMVN